MALPFILGPWLLRRLPAFTARYPGLRVQLRFGDRLTRLVDDHIDVAIRVGKLRDSSVLARKLADSRWRTVAAPAYLDRRGIPRKPAQLDEHDCLVFRSPRGVEVPWEFLEHPGSQRSTTHMPPARIVLDQGELFVAGAIAGLGIAQVLECMVDAELRSGQLVEVLGDHACAGPPIHALCKPGQRKVAKVRAMLDFLAQA